MASFRLTESAKTDLRRIYRRGLREFGERRADKYYQTLFDRFDQIAANPHLYPTVDEILPGVRRSVCGADSIYYKAGESDVEILAIVGRQDVADWLSID